MQRGEVMENLQFPFKFNQENWKHQTHLGSLVVSVFQKYP